MNFIYFAWKKLTKWSPRFIYAQKAPFSTNQDIFNKNFADSIVKLNRIFHFLSSIKWYCTVFKKQKIADSLAKISRIFRSFPVLDDILWYLMKLSKIYWNFMTSNKILQYSFDYIQSHCILWTFAFAFDDFKSLLQKFGLIQTGWKFVNFCLGNGERWKSQYRSYLPLQSTCCILLKILLAVKDFTV